MDAICTACLCIGRKLYFIGETGSYHLYSQILKEIPVYELPRVFVRVCWECRALLRRFGEFKALVKASYSLLLQHLHQNTPSSKDQLVRPSRLKISLIQTIDCPVSVKEELAPAETYLTENDPAKHETEQEHIDIEDVDTADYPYVDDGNVSDSYEAVKKEDVLEVNGNDREDVKKPTKKNTKARRKTVKTKLTSKKPVEKTTIEFENEELRRERLEDYSDMDSDNFVNDGNEERVEEERIIEDVNVKKVVKRKKEADPGEFYCAACDKQFASVATYRQHLRLSRSHVSESEFSFKCNECGKKFVSKTKLRDHVDWEHMHKFRCQFCDKALKSYESLYGHMRNIHKNNSKENLCNICGKSSQNATILKNHIVAMHTSQTPYRCGHCRATFRWHSNLYRHVRGVHHQAFKSYKSLYGHMRNIHKDNSKENLCNICGKSYQNATILKNHIVAMHTSGTPYRCGYCRATFGWYSSLHRHVRDVHHQAFKSHTSLYVHMQNIQENLCNICGKSYQNATILINHIVAMHTSEIPYRCGHCRATFRWYPNLRRHVRDVHHQDPATASEAEETQTLLDSDAVVVIEDEESPLTSPGLPQLVEVTQFLANDDPHLATVMLSKMTLMARPGTQPDKILIHKMEARNGKIYVPSLKAQLKSNALVHSECDGLIPEEPRIYVPKEVQVETTACIKKQQVCEKQKTTEPRKNSNPNKLIHVNNLHTIPVKEVSKTYGKKKSQNPGSDGNGKIYVPSLKAQLKSNALVHSECDGLIPEEPRIYVPKEVQVETTARNKKQQVCEKQKTTKPQKKNSNPNKLIHVNNLHTIPVKEVSKTYGKKKSQNPGSDGQIYDPGKNPEANFTSTNSAKMPRFNFETDDDDR